jgi:SHS2 domain-containing protein
MSTAPEKATMSYRLREHTADIAVEATAPDLGSLFGAIADGLAAAMCESIPDDGGDRFGIECRAESVEALLYEYLDQLIYERDVRLVLPVDNEADIQDHDDAWLVTSSARGVPLGSVTAREIKAVTYSEMVVDRREDGWYGYVVFDV